MVCVDNPSPPSQSPLGPNIGAIAGGVVGGIAFICIVVFLVWFLWIRKRRAQQEAEAEEWEEEDDIAQQKAAFQSMLHDAASTRTRGSFANSVLSRASNVIQIAFIPGVTTRTASSPNSPLTTPVPPVPAARSIARSPLANQDDAIFFRPGDIRDSSYSNTSSIALDRRDTQYTVDSRDSSMTPASVYHESLTIQPIPAQASRAVPRMVSVKTSNTGSSTESDPSTSAGNKMQIVMPGQGKGPSASGSLRSQGAFAKAQQITVGNKGKGRFPIKTVVDTSSAAKDNARHVPDVSSPLRDANDEDTDEEEQTRAKKSLLKTSPAPAKQDNPFYDPVDASRPNAYASMSSTIQPSGSPKRGKSMGGLSAVIEEATRKASSPPLHEGLGGRRDSSPFGDNHQLK